MSKSTSINEGGRPRPFGPVKALMVQGEDGKYYSWYPEEERALATKHIDKNGIYRAADDGVYGYSSVTVNVQTTDSVTGKDPDTGETVVIRPDPETGEIVKTSVPTEIRVITPPTNPYGTYMDGQTIAKDGMVVKAYDANGNEMQIVPNREITLNPTTAVYDASQDKPTRGTATYDGKAVDYAKGVDWGNTRFEPSEDGSPMPKETEFDYYAWSSAYIIAVSRNTIIDLYAISLSSEIPTGGHVFVAPDGKEGYTLPMVWADVITSSYNVDGVKKTFYIKNCQYTYKSDRMKAWHGSLNPSGYDLSETAKIIFEGDKEETPAGSPQTITVSWPRPGDGAILETTFDILVGPHGGTGDD